VLIKKIKNKNIWFKKVFKKITHKEILISWYMNLKNSKGGFSKSTWIKKNFSSLNFSLKIKLVDSKIVFFLGHNRCHHIFSLYHSCVLHGHRFLKKKNLENQKTITNTNSNNWKQSLILYHNTKIIIHSSSWVFLLFVFFFTNHQLEIDC
jgi:hypothetical protein